MLWLAFPAAADAPPLVVLVQPLPADERVLLDYQPLARYLEVLTGRRCRVEAPATFPAYWNVLRRNNYDIALDGPHFTDYRAFKFRFTALVKIPDTASYSLLMRRAERVIDPLQLVGRRIAAFGTLSTGATRLNAMFPNPVRQPVLVEVQSVDEGLELLLDRRVEAAFLPTAAANRRLIGDRLATVLTTEPVTHLILSASLRLPPKMRAKIRDAFLRAQETDEGRAMLQGTGLTRFEPVTAESFANQRNALKTYWGY